MFCSRCGTEVQTTAKFCPSCGLDLASATPHGAHAAGGDEAGASEKSDTEMVKDALKAEYDVLARSGWNGHRVQGPRPATRPPGRAESRFRAKAFLQPCPKGGGGRSLPISSRSSDRVVGPDSMIHPSAFIAPGAIVLGDVTLGRDSSVWYNSVVRGDTAPITVGDASNLQDLTVVHVDAGVPCTIGRRVGVVGHRAILHGCTVEDDSLVGMGAILLNHVRVGTGSVIGAGAVLPEGTEVLPGSLGSAGPSDPCGRRPVG